MNLRIERVPIYVHFGRNPWNTHVNLLNYPKYYHWYDLYQIDCSFDTSIYIYIRENISNSVFVSTYVQFKHENTEKSIYCQFDDI